MSLRRFVFALLGVACVLGNAFAQDSNYVLDCNPEGNVLAGVVTIPPVSAFDSIMTIQFDLNPRASWGSNWIVYSVDSNSQNAVGVAVYNQGGGNAYLKFLSGSTAVDSATFALPSGSFTSLAIVVDTTATQKVVFYRNGAVISASTAALSVVATSRTVNICHGRGYNGLLDNFAVWQQARTQTQIQEWTKVFPMPSNLQEQLEFWLPFDEGFGNSAVAITPTTANTGANWIRAALDQAQFGYANLRPLMRCQTWGDPHIYAYSWNSKQGLESNRPAVPQQIEWTDGTDPSPEQSYGGHLLNGVHRMSSCNSTFEARILANKQPSWWAHVNRATSFRAYDKFYLVTLEGEVPGTNGMGAYTRTGENTAWTAIPNGVYQDANGVTYRWDRDALAFDITMPQVGYAQVRLGWAYINMDLFLDMEKCQSPNRKPGMCDWTHKSGAEPIRIDFLEWKYGGEPTEPAPITPEPACDGAVKVAAEASCLAYGSPTGTPASQSRYAACVQDICSSGDPELTADLPPTRECQMADFAAMAAGTYNGVSSCGASCPNGCSAHGKCNAGVCSCLAGWVGKDCGQPSSFDCYDLNVVSDAQNEIRKVESFSLFNNQNPRDVAERFAVEDSIVIFPAADRGNDPNSAAALNRNLVIALDSTRSKDGGAVNMQLTFNTNIAANQVEGGVATGSNVVTINRSWTMTNTQNFVTITGLPTAYTMSINVISSTGIVQLLVGSATRRAELDVLKIAPVDWVNGRTVLTAKACSADTCANLINSGDQLSQCSTCNTNTACGFCVESGRCMLGDAAGPRRGQCRHWRYQPGSTTVSRRVTMEFGWPVTPSYTEVILTDAGDTSVPVDVRVNAGNLGNQWDVVLMLENNVDDDLITLVNSISSKLLPTLQDSVQFPNIAFGLSRYGSDGVQHLKDLGSVNPNTVWQYQRALDSFTGNDNGLKDAVAALNYVVPGSGAAPKWRSQARRLVVVQTSYLPAVNSQTESFLNALRTKLVDNRIIPVWAVNTKREPTLKAAYNQIVNDYVKFGFGLVVDLASDSSDMHVAVQKGIRLAQGQIAMVRKNNGFVDQDNLQAQASVLNILGLTNNHRGRFHIPVTRPNGVGLGEHRLAELSAVGFGTTKIQDIASERPTCQGARIEILEDNVATIYLQGDSYRGLVKPVQFTIESIPDAKTKGSLFQATVDNKLGAKITTAGTTVTHPSGLVYFVPIADGNGGPNAATTPYTAFTFKSFDGCIPSGSGCTINIHVMPVNDPPTVPGDLTDETNEDVSKVLTLFVQDPDFNPVSDTIKFAVTTYPAHGKLMYIPDNVDVSSGTPFPSAGTGLRQLDVTYIPDANYNGPDFFAYRATDQAGATSRIHQFFLTVHPINDQPTGSVGTPVTVKEDTLTAITLGGADIDFDRVKFRIEFPVALLGNLYSDAAGKTPITNGLVLPVADGLDVPAGLAVYYKAPADSYSCVDGNVPGVDCNAYESFQFYVNDNTVDSAVVKVPIFVFNVNDPPIAKPKSVTFAEDTCGEVTLTATDIDSKPASVFFEITSFAPNLIVKDSTGKVLSAGSPNNKVDASGKITICSFPNEFGDATPGEWQWWLNTLQYQANDGSLTSDIVPVDVFVTPVNDAPVAKPGTITTYEDTPVVVGINAFDVDNTEDQLSFFVAVLPNVAHGVLYQYDNTQAGNLGAKVVAGRTIAVTRQSNGERLLVFVPTTNYFGAASFTFEVIDDDAHGNNNLWSNVAQVDIAVLPVNDAPVAGLDTPAVVTEDGSLVITLTGNDNYFGENTPLQAVITAPLTAGGDCQDIGKLYQYTAGKAPADYTEGERITAAAISVTDSNNRVFYIPPANKNSDHAEPYKFIRPIFQYKLVEINPEHLPGPLSSNVVQVEITITPVNDLPVVVARNMIDPDADLSNVCWENCAVLEDLGHHYRETAGTVGIYFGGDDIERSNLDILIVGVICPVDASLMTIEDVPQDVPRDASETNPFVLPIDVELYKPARCSEDLPFTPLIQALTFTPAADKNDDNSGNGEFYCKITYRVRDSQSGISADSKDITISVQKVNDAPRADEYIKRIFTFEDEPASFPVTSFDVENNGYNLQVLSCGASGRGAFFVGTPDQGEVEIDCDDLPRTLSVFPANAQGKSVATWRFVPLAGENQPTPYNEIVFNFPETGSTPAVMTGQDLYTVEVTVLPKNAAPTIALPNDGDVVSDQRRVPVPIAFADSDVDAKTTALEFTATIEWTGEAKVRGNVYVQGAQVTLPWTSTLSLPELNAILATVEVEASQDQNDETASLLVSANDNGNTGSCKDPVTGQFSECALTTTAPLTVRFTQVAGVVSTAVGAGSAAAAGFAAALAALAYRRFRKREDVAEPWTFDEDDQGAMVNPLYADNGLGGDNPLYQFGEATNPQ